MPRDYESAPVTEALNLKEIIAGLAGDLQNLRAGKITAHQALAHAAVAKQIFNGCRIYLQGYALMDAEARKASGVPVIEAPAKPAAAAGKRTK